MPGCPRPAKRCSDSASGSVRAVAGYAIMALHPRILALAPLFAAACQASTSPADTLIATADAAPPQAAPPADLDPGRGEQIGQTFEGFLSPWQESNEESATPKTTPEVFRSTGKTLTRAERARAGHRGHGTLRFTKDLSRAYVDVKIEGIDPKTINMFHIHCGKPGILGPILVDFALATDVQQNFIDDGVFSVEVTDELIAATEQHGHGHGPVAAFTMGCIIGSASLESLEPAKVLTVAGMAQIAREGELYFNVHTTSQTYFGDIRGQIYPQ
jgi:hypothetical protein